MKLQGIPNIEPAVDQEKRESMIDSAAEIWFDVELGSGYKLIETKADSARMLVPSIDVEFEWLFNDADRRKLVIRAVK